MKCISSNQTFIVGFCYVKAVSRKVTTVNVDISIIRDIDEPVLLSIEAYFRYSLTFRKMMGSEINACDFVGMATDSPLAWIISQNMKEQKFWHLVHPCPYKNVRNLI